jgi:hypothetical protein
LCAQAESPSFFALSNPGKEKAGATAKAAKMINLN